MLAMWKSRKYVSQITDNSYQKVKIVTSYQGLATSESCCLCHPEDDRTKELNT